MLPRYILAWLALSSLVGHGVQAAAPSASAPTILLISIDGLKPEAVIDATGHGLIVPNLQALMADGAFASGVRGVLPTLTYPSHTTLITGASPAKHGIYANTTFDPFNRNQQGWYWYAQDIKVPTLWDAAAAAHLRTANVYWPVSVGANITYNLPQIWRNGTADDLKLQRALSTPGLERELSPGLAPYPGGMDETVADDEIRSSFAIRLLETRRPEFFTVYFTGLDTEQHHSGPFSQKSNAVLERIDRLVGNLRSAAERVTPGRATICVVSDHGFAGVLHDVNLPSAFVDAGLISVDSAGTITAWEAVPWPAGGSAAVVLRNPEDPLLRSKVSALLTKLAAEPANGIDRVLSRDEIQQSRGFPSASFLVAFREGYEMANKLTPPLIAHPSNLGMHGYLPELPEMRSAFFIVGPHIRKQQSLGEIDMRRIAPTLAAILRVHLDGAELEPLKISMSERPLIERHENPIE